MLSTVIAETRPVSAERANEDWYLTSGDLVVVLDGATIRTETGCIHGLPWYVRQLGSAIVTAVQNYSSSLPEGLAAAIKTVSDLHSDTCDLNHPGTPSAAVGVVRRNGESLEWMTLGDITVMVAANDQLHVTCDDRVSYTAQAERRECDRHLLGTAAKLAAIEAMKPLELAARNIEGGYWIAAAQPDAAYHAYTSLVPFAEATEVGVCSDGAMRALRMTSIPDHRALLDAMQQSPRYLIDHVRKAEHNDPQGTRYPRNKALDDATAVYVELRGDELGS